MKRFFALLLLLGILFSSSACGDKTTEGSASASFHGSADAAVSSSPERPASQSDELSAPISPAELLSNMTLEQKVGQLFFVRVPENSAAADVTQYHLGGYLFFGRDVKDKTANELIQTIHLYQNSATADSGIPLLIGTDEEGGSVVRVSSNSHLRSEKFRSPQDLYADGGMERIVSDAHEKSVLLSALGFNVNLAPVCDVSTNPSDFMFDRSFGQDAQATAAYAAQVTAAMSSEDMGSVLKHFPGYGNNVDTHTGIAVDTRPLETFTSSDFLPFSSGINSGGGKTAVLVCHNIVQCMDADLPASLSPAVHQLLRETLGFDGVIMTDDLAMDAVSTYAKNGHSAVMAFQSGNDMVITTDYRSQIPQVLAAVQDDTLDESTIDAACLRVLTWKAELGLL